MSRKLIGERAMTISERTSKLYNKIKNDPIKYAKLKEKRAIAYRESLYDPVKQKNKADEILRKVGI